MGINFCNWSLTVMVIRANASITPWLLDASVPAIEISVRYDDNCLHKYNVTSFIEYIIPIQWEKVNFLKNIPIFYRLTGDTVFIRPEDLIVQLLLHLHHCRIDPLFYRDVIWGLILLCQTLCHISDNSAAEALSVNLWRVGKLIPCTKYQSKWEKFATSSTIEGAWWRIPNCLIVCLVDS